MIREEVTVQGVSPPLENDLPYSPQHGLVEASLIAYAFHIYQLFAMTMPRSIFDLQRVLHAMSYLDSIKPFERPRNG